MKIDGEVKTETWKERNEREDAELAENAERSAINFYSIFGIAIVVIGILVGLFAEMYSGINTAALGVIIMGIGEILRFLRKIAKHR
ncbi:hypothetical protein ACFPYJ_17655 [Paenibacillus solisilvae]|uniref:DUF2335 domain-containing protein n=1 Tax=Paenibacillus solisilvae TaxID=2486751 RepID=A0ABW0W3G9_9BACL